MHYESNLIIIFRWKWRLIFASMIVHIDARRNTTAIDRYALQIIRNLERWIKGASFVQCTCQRKGEKCTPYHLTAMDSWLWLHRLKWFPHGCDESTRYTPLRPCDLCWIYRVGPYADVYTPWAGRDHRRRHHCIPEMFTPAISKGYWVSPNRFLFDWRIGNQKKRPSQGGDERKRHQFLLLTELHS